MVVATALFLVILPLQVGPKWCNFGITLGTFICVGGCVLVGLGLDLVFGCYTDVF